MRDKSSITRSQRIILDAVIFFMQKGEIPTVREIGAVAGLRSPATVFKHLRSLEKMGIVTLNGKSRGVRLVSEEALASVGIKLGPGKRTSKRGGPLFPISGFAPARFPGIPLVGEIAAGKPIESYSEAFLPDGVDQHGLYRDENPSSFRSPTQAPTLSLDPALFGESGELMALRVDGSSMINAGIIDGDYVIIRRQSMVEEGEIAAVIVNGEGTLKRWKTHSPAAASKNKKGSSEKKKVTLVPANELFEPIEISEEDGKDVVVFGKYVGLVRGNLQINR